MKTTEERACLYLAKLPPSVSGQGGHDACFRAACVLIHKFGLRKAPALRLLAEWNKTNCQPPWSAKELRHKIDSAIETRPRPKLAPIPPPPIVVSWGFLPPGSPAIQRPAPTPTPPPWTGCPGEPIVVSWGFLPPASTPTTADAKQGVQQAAQAQPPLF